MKEFDDEKEKIVNIKSEIKTNNVTPLKEENVISQENLILDQKYISHKSNNSFGKISKFLFTDNTKLGKGLSIEKTLEQEFYFEKEKINTLFQAIFSIISILTGIIEFEIFLIGTNQKKDYSVARQFSLSLCFISSIGLWMTIIFEFFIENKLLYFNNDLHESIWRKQPKRIAELVIVLLAFFLHPNPVFYDKMSSLYVTKYNIYVNHSLNGLMSVYNLIKIYYLTKYYLMNTAFYNTRTQRICEINNIDTSLFFSLKSQMTMKPIETYAVFFTLLVAVLTYALRFFERELDSVSKLEFNLYSNNIWCLIITMTTVGYGDYFPSSDAGRLIGIVACIFGVFILSMFMLTISLELDLQGNDSTVYSIINRIENIEERKLLAKKLITKYLKSMRDLQKIELMNEGNDKEDLKFTKHKDILISLHNFKEENMIINASLPQYNQHDQIVEKLRYLEETIGKIKGKIIEVESIIDKICESLNILTFDVIKE